MYIVVRIIIVGVLLVFAVFAIKKTQKLRKRVCYIISLIAAMILTTVLAFLPFENLFLTFDSPDAAYMYYNSNQSPIDLIIHGKECDFVVDAKKDADTHLIIPKTERGWQIGIGIDTKRKTRTVSNGIVVNVYQYKNTNEYFITVLDTNGGRSNVSDNHNTNFFSLEKNNETLQKTFVTYYAHLPDVKSSYSVFVNGNEIVLNL